VYDLNNQKKLNHFKGHKEWVTGVHYDNNHLYSSSRDGSILIYDVNYENKEAVASFKDGVSFVGVYKCKNTGLIYGANDNGVIYVFDEKSGKLEKKLYGHLGIVFRAEPNQSDGKKLYSCNNLNN
jgi:sperm-associated antigen 16 protein